MEYIIKNEIKPDERINVFQWNEQNTGEMIRLLSEYEVGYFDRVSPDEMCLKSYNPESNENIRLTLYRYDCLVERRDGSKYIVRQDAFGISLKKDDSNKTDGEQFNRFAYPLKLEKPLTLKELLKRKSH